MEKMIAMLGIKYLSNKLDGKNTLAGSVVLLLVGIVKIIMGFVMFAKLIWPSLNTPEISGPIDVDMAWQSIQLGAASFGLGWAAIGLGRKSEKLKDAISETTNP